jgi:replication factor C small subunit
MQDSSIWTEKYRPKKFTDIKGQDNIVRRVKALVDVKNLPHLLFIGPAGIGKTTLALVISKELYKDEVKNNFLELNASDERGIDVIRNKVKDFARTKSISTVPFKIIYLDECDSLTKEAQQALRRTMETYANSCRFVLSCNFGSKLIDPIKSRCSIFKFRPLEQESLKELINKIAANENINISEDAKEILIKASKGDVRQLENFLQSSSSISKDITVETLSEVVSEIEPKEVKEALLKTITGKFTEAKDLLLKTMLIHGLSGLDIIKQIQKNVWSLPVSDEKKLNMIEMCGEIEFRIVEGSDDFVQLIALLANFTQITVQ